MIGKLFMNPYVIMGLVLFYLISVSGSYLKGRSHGYDSCKVEWDEANRKAQEEADKTQEAIDKEVVAVFNIDNRIIIIEDYKEEVKQTKKKVCTK